MQNFTAEKWANKIALFIDNFGFLSGFFWHWTIALPSPTSHLAMLHSKIILSDPNRRVKVVLIGFSLFWSRCRTWGRLDSLNKNWSWKDEFIVVALSAEHEAQAQMKMSAWICIFPPLEGDSVYVWGRGGVPFKKKHQIEPLLLPVPYYY